jgi:hypothetical protein
MNLVTKLHTAARRHCLLRRRFWLEQAGLREDGAAQPGPLVIAQALELLLDEVEQILPEEHGSLQEMSDALRLASQVAMVETRDLLFSEHAGAAGTHMPAANRELDAFRDLIARLRESDLVAVEDLPHHRLFTGEECRALWAKIEHIWGISVDEGWASVEESLDPARLVVFDAEAFQAQIAPAELQGGLMLAGVKHLLEFCEDGSVYEVDMLFLEEFARDAEEVYWTTASMDWVIGCCDAEMVILGGKTVIDCVKGLWPNWQMGLHPQDER